MSDPTFLAILSTVFVALGVFNIASGLRKLRQARAQGQSIRWYRQLQIPTGIEYILISLVFIMSISIRYSIIPGSFQVLIIPFYTIVLLSSAIMAGFVVRQAFKNSRRRSTTSATNNSTFMTISDDTDDTHTATSDQATINQRRRARRQKAAAARRRHAGKA